jgi:hypothetical protein
MGFLDVVPSDHGTFQLRWRSLEDWPLMVRASTGEQARLVRRVTSDVDVANLPRIGRVTLTFEECIANDQGQTFDEWDETDWKLQDEIVEWGASSR